MVILGRHSQAFTDPRCSRSRPSINENIPLLTKHTLRNCAQNANIAGGIVILFRVAGYTAKIAICIH